MLGWCLTLAGRRRAGGGREGSGCSAGGLPDGRAVHRPQPGAAAGQGGLPQVTAGAHCRTCFRAHVRLLAELLGISVASAAAARESCCASFMYSVRQLLPLSAGQHLGTCTHLQTEGGSIPQVLRQMLPLPHLRAGPLLAVEQPHVSNSGLREDSGDGTATSSVGAMLDERWHRCWFVLDADSFRIEENSHRQGSGACDGPSVDWQRPYKPHVTFRARTAWHARQFYVCTSQSCFRARRERALVLCCDVQAATQQPRSACHWQTSRAPSLLRTPACQRARRFGCRAPASPRC